MPVALKNGQPLGERPRNLFEVIAAASLQFFVGVQHRIAFCDGAREVRPREPSDRNDVWIERSRDTPEFRPLKQVVGPRHDEVRGTSPSRRLTTKRGHHRHLPWDRRGQWHKHESSCRPRDSVRRQMVEGFHQPELCAEDQTPPTWCLATCRCGVRPCRLLAWARAGTHLRHRNSEWRSSRRLRGRRRSASSRIRCNPGSWRRVRIVVPLLGTSGHARTPPPHGGQQDVADDSDGNEPQFGCGRSGASRTGRIHRRPRSPYRLTSRHRQSIAGRAPPRGTRSD